MVGETSQRRPAKAELSRFRVMTLALKVLAVSGLDLLAGDPRWIPHPVRFMGRMIAGYERVVLQRTQGRISRYVAGGILALGLPCLFYAGAAWLIEAVTQLHPWAGHAAWIVLGYTTLAARDLADHASEVYRRLQDGTFEEARRAVSQIVGRDTASLSEQDIVKATVESVAESTSDGVIAPLFYLAIGGPPLALAYKAVNTLDSMIGHRTEDYQYFGWAAARCDDVMNWVPARLSGLYLVVASALCLKSGRTAARVLLRDARKHSSPNSGWPEAAMAGGLRVQLGGVNEYDGRSLERPFLGDAIRILKPQQIPRAIQLMYTASGLMLLTVLGVVAW